MAALQNHLKSRIAKGEGLTLCAKHNLGSGLISVRQFPMVVPDDDVVKTDAAMIASK